MISLTSTDYDNIHSWRCHYSYCDNVDSMVSVPEILESWSEAKSNHLYKLLGNQLMYKESLTFKAPTNKLHKHIVNLCSESSFRDSIIEYFYAKEGYYGPITSNISYLFDAPTLVKNIYQYTTFYINPPMVPKKIKVEKNCKVSRILGRIAKEIGLEKEYEEFRIKHSQILNTKEITGELVLSIHPFDYLTMSDNDCGWDSCMSWRHHEGEYRQGTIEMMNSPTVLVAYLRNPNDITLPNGNPWSNKQWRELFIVDEDIICNVRAYPYNNDTLTDTIIAKLRDLAEKNLGWTYSNNSICDIPFEKFIFGTNFMYNDFDRDDENTYHCVYNTLNFSKCVHYSGPDMCIFCGNINVVNSENKVVCEDCYNPLYCDECGIKISTVNNDDYYTTRDYHYICADCYENANLTKCDISGDVFYNSSRVTTLPVHKNGKKIATINIAFAYVGWYDKSLWFYHPEEVNLNSPFIDYNNLTTYAKIKLLIF